MIEIKITDNHIEMSGHACRWDDDGIDRACAAVSALTCNLVNSLRELSGDTIQAEMDSGHTVIDWEEISEGGQLLVSSWLLGLQDIDQEYNCINFSN